MSTHTPGPWWTVPPRFNAARRMQVYAEGGLGDFAVAKSIYYPSDASLIAAAPDLYAALERMLGPAGYTDDNSITRQAKAALAKARGEKQT